jgi:GT2 family glycosyltransferase
VNTDVTFSAVVTFFNQREFVADAIESVLALGRDDVELIAVDDASSDGTVDALRAYEGSVKLVLLEENQGLSGARNAGAAEATGDYVLFFDGDDALLSWTFDAYEAVARERRPVTMIGSYLWFEGERPDPGEAPEQIEFIEYADYFRKDRSLGAWGGATALDTRAFREVGGFDPAVPVCEDYDLMWRLGLSGPVVYITSPATVLHRAHAGQVTQKGAKILPAIRQLVEREYAGRYPGTGMRALERRACVGGCALYWALLLRRGHARLAAGLLLRSLPLIVAAVVVRARNRVRGRTPARALSLRSRRAAVEAGD